MSQDKPGTCHQTAAEEQRWETMALEDIGDLSIPLWRRFCDQLHVRIVREWTGGARFASAFKTDLFDEVVGTGLADWLLTVSDHVEGVDIATGIVEQAVQRHPGLRARQADVRRLVDHPSGSFDLVVSNSTLDHFADQRDLAVALAELSRILMPGGLLFVTLDNPRNPVVALRNRLASRWTAPGPLVPYFMGHTVPLEELTRLLTAAGLHIERTGYLMHVPRVLFLHASRWVALESWTGKLLLRLMQGCEILETLPTRAWTGHFSVVLARKPKP